MNCGLAPIPSDTWGCSTDFDCLETEYCAQGTCLTNGMCQSDSDCMNPNHIFADVYCVGYLECGDDGFCKRNCGEQCKNGQQEKQCTVTGCDTKIYCPGAVSCVPDYCNDCKAIYFDAAGSVVSECNIENNEVDKITTEPSDGAFFTIDAAEDESTGNDIAALKEPSPTTCTSDKDCISAKIGRSTPLDRNGSYCAQGVCMDMGSCISDSDCHNPINVFDDLRCIGFLTCGDDGMCTRVCGEPCKDGSKQINCFINPCDTKQYCSGAVSCQANYCGETCEAVYYNAAGEVITDCEYAKDEPFVSRVGPSNTTSEEKEVDMDDSESLATESGAMKYFTFYVSTIYITSSLSLAFII